MRARSGWLLGAFSINNDAHVNGNGDLWGTAAVRFIDCHVSWWEQLRISLYEVGNMMVP